MQRKRAAKGKFDTWAEESFKQWVKQDLKKETEWPLKDKNIKASDLDWKPKWN